MAHKGTGSSGWQALLALVGLVILQGCATHTLSIVMTSPVQRLEPSLPFRDLSFQFLLTEAGPRLLVRQVHKPLGCEDGPAGWAVYGLSAEGAASQPILSGVLAPCSKTRREVFLAPGSSTFSVRTAWTEIEAVAAGKDIWVVESQMVEYRMDEVVVDPVGGGSLRTAGAVELLATRYSAADGKRTGEPIRVQGPSTSHGLWAPGDGRAVLVTYNWLFPEFQNDDTAPQTLFFDSGRPFDSFSGHLRVVQLTGPGAGTSVDIQGEIPGGIMMELMGQVTFQNGAGIALLAWSKDNLLNLQAVEWSGEGTIVGPATLLERPAGEYPKGDTLAMDRTDAGVCWSAVMFTPEGTTRTLRRRSFLRTAAGQWSEVEQGCLPQNRCVEGIDSRLTGHMELVVYMEDRPEAGAEDVPRSWSVPHETGDPPYGVSAACERDGSLCWKVRDLGGARFEAVVLRPSE